MKLVLGLVGFTMVMFLFERIRADLVALVVLVMLGLTGLVAPEELFDGFSGNAVISVIATMILGAGLDRTGALNRLAGWLLRRAHGVEQRLLLLHLGGRRPQLLVHAEPVGDGAVPAGRLAPVLAHRPAAVAPAAADGRRHRDGRRADHGRQLAADPAQRPAGRRPTATCPRARRRSNRCACSRRCRSAWRCCWPALAYFRFFGDKRLRRRTRQRRRRHAGAHRELLRPAPTASKATCSNSRSAPTARWSACRWAKPRRCTARRCCSR